MKIESKKWLVTFLAVQSFIVLAIALLVVWIDPWMYYHKPLTDSFYYHLNLDGERLVNFGIAKNFEYDSIIIGSSMTENFKTTEFDELFGAKAVKLSVSGVDIKNIQDILKIGLKNHEELRYIISSFSPGELKRSKESWGEEDNTYPMYLSDENPMNDINYLLNKQVVLNYCAEMLLNKIDGEKPGITSFDDYANWSSAYQYGKEVVLAGRTEFLAPEKEEIHLSEDEKRMIDYHVENDIIPLIREHPDTEYFYFYPPYSVASWGAAWEKSSLALTVETERYVTSVLLKCNCTNLHLFSFSTMLDITADLDNYKDAGHYGEWINSLILQYIHDGIGELTIENYERFFDEEYDLYSTYDYNRLW